KIVGNAESGKYVREPHCLDGDGMAAGPISYRNASVKGVPRRMIVANPERCFAVFCRDAHAENEQLTSFDLSSKSMRGGRHQSRVCLDRQDCTALVQVKRGVISIMHPDIEHDVL